MTKRRFFVVGKDGEHLDHFRVLERGTLEKVAPSLPFDIGEELEVKLGEVGLYDGQAGAGKVGDVTVVVGNAAKQVGKKVKVRVNAVGQGVAWAELLAPADAADEPLTAEAEAEKPTRAKRSTTPKPVKDVAAVEEEEEEVTDEDDFVPDETAEGEAPAAPAKKKTRRGSRGGRNRKKKTDTAAEAATTNGGESPEEHEAVAEPEVEPEVEVEVEPAGPVIHVPDRELDEDGDGAAPAKKKTRRGSRGGRNRKKKTATAAVGGDGDSDGDGDGDGEGTVAVEEAPEPEAAPEEPSQNGEPEPDWGYTPMNQWGLDDTGLDSSE